MWVQEARTERNTWAFTISIQLLCGFKKQELKEILGRSPFQYNFCVGSSWVSALTFYLWAWISIQLLCGFKLHVITFDIARTTISIQLLCGFKFFFFIISRNCRTNFNTTFVWVQGYEKKLFWQNKRISIQLLCGFKLYIFYSFFHTLSDFNTTFVWVQGAYDTNTRVANAHFNTTFVWVQVHVESRQCHQVPISIQLLCGFKYAK